MCFQGLFLNVNKMKTFKNKLKIACIISLYLYNNNIETNKLKGELK